MERTPIRNLICFSHLRWDFVYQRPQHLMSRFAQRGLAVHFFEEPIYEAGVRPHLRRRTDRGVQVVQPVLPPELRHDATRAQRELLDAYTGDWRGGMLMWYYTPMALEFSRHLPGPRIYDCMDELSLFAGAPPQLRSLEEELLALSAVVFTGGRSLYYHKRRSHGNVHCFPSAVDADHFAARGHAEPEVLRGLRRPRIGFYGVIDERLDIPFVRSLAANLTDWEVVLAGPVVKIDPATLPQAPNLHYPGMQPYDALPALLQHWDVAFLPFARNDATRFISPTKTLEYLAARKPVISTPIADVVDPYGSEGLVEIATTGEEAAVHARTLLQTGRPQAWHNAVDRLVRECNWDTTVARMHERLPAAVSTGKLERAV